MRRGIALYSGPLLHGPTMSKATDWCLFCHTQFTTTAKCKRSSKRDIITGAEADPGSPYVNKCHSTVEQHLSISQVNLLHSTRRTKKTEEE